MAIYVITVSNVSSESSKLLLTTEVLTG